MPVLSFQCHHRYRSGFDLEISFEIDRRFTSLFGPSGSGKTSVLGIISGLLRPQQGSVRLGDRTLLDTARGIYLPPEARI
jgi:molybdate transport system ATP-binding protein